MADLAKLVRSLELATAQMQKLRAQRDAARAHLRLETDRRSNAEHNESKAMLALIEQRRTVQEQGRQIRELEATIRGLRAELAVARTQIPPPPVVPVAPPAPVDGSVGSVDNPTPDDSTSIRFSLLEPHEGDS